MTNPESSPTEHSKVPVLIAPREEAVVDGAEVTFTWKPAPGAKTYTVQIAADSAFRNIIHEEQAGSHTSIVVKDAAPTDQGTYFWRVLTRDAEGKVRGHDNIESFLSVESEVFARRMKSPDQVEEYGPVGQLARAARAEAAREITQDPRYLSEEIKLGVEHEGVESGQIIGLVLAVAVALVFSIFGLVKYFNITAEEVRYEVAGLSGYPELRENRLQASQRLTQYGAAEGEENRYRIPIDRAIELMANEAYQNPAGETYSRELELLPRD